MSEFEEVIRYVSDFSILVITPYKLTRVYCPFRVSPIQDFALLEVKKVYMVIRVVIDRDTHTVFIINGLAYNAKHFLLML